MLAHAVGFDRLAKHGLGLRARVGGKPQHPAHHRQQEDAGTDQGRDRVPRHAEHTLLDVNEDRLNFCRTQFKVDLTVAGGWQAAVRLREITSGDMPTAVFDATGNRQSMIEAFDLVAHSGRLILVGLMLGDVSFHDPDAHRRELTMLCSRNATAANFQRIISLMESRQIDTTPWITHLASISSMIEAFPTWIDPRNKVIKAMVHIEGG